jgi:poly(3-hydroxybutyrate) depolymerase
MILFGFWIPCLRRDDRWRRDDRQRSYLILHLPTITLPDKPTAVVIVLHGGGG